MRTRATLPVIALLALLMLGSGAAIAGKSKTVRTDLQATYKKGTADNPYVPERDPAFKGTVAAKKSACESKRKVKVKGVGADKTDSKGRFKINASKAGPGRYKVKVAKRRAGKFVCKAAKTKVRVKAAQ